MKTAARIPMLLFLTSSGRNLAILAHAAVEDDTMVNLMNGSVDKGDLHLTHYPGFTLRDPASS
jgi:hypothetical protein